MCYVLVSSLIAKIESSDGKIDIREVTFLQANIVSAFINSFTFRC